MTASGPPARVSVGIGCYVYGVVPAAEAPERLFEGIEGVAGGSVKLVTAGALAAIVSEVPLSEFGEEPIAENLRDPDWLERRVRAHEEVLEAALPTVPVVPFRFGTIYRGEAQLHDMLNAHARLALELDRVRGKLELGVKGFLASLPGAPEASIGESTVTAGRRYLEEKQRARRLAEERDALKERLAAESHERLAAVADEAAANPPQPREVSGADTEMFLNGAYLVRAGTEPAFRDVLAELEQDFAETGATYELTGPWPPYNFVEDAA